MNIQQIETYTKTNVSLVRITTDSGASGWGQISPYNSDISAAVLHRQIAPHALGKQACDISSLVDHVMEATYKFSDARVRP